MSNSHLDKSIQAGFTLIELMVVVVISAILLAVAVPSFESLIKKSNVDSLQSKLSSALATARTEAASRNKIVSICASSDGIKCTGAHWSSGWIIFEGDPPASSADVPTASLIDVFSTGAPAYTISASAPSGSTVTSPTFITFTSQGFIKTTGSNATLLTICEPKKAATYARALYVNASGLVMKSRDTNVPGDSIHNNPITSTSNLACP